MAKITVITEDCRDKVSTECEGTFTYERKRGRPPVNCPKCREVLKSNQSAKPVSVRKVAEVETHDCNSVEWECIVNNDVTDHRKVSKLENCPCGNTFTVALSGRGRRATKCNACREAGTVYRANDDGMMEAIRAETLAEESREIREQNGRDRAQALWERMQPLIERDTKRRKVAA